MESTRRAVLDAIAAGRGITAALVLQFDGTVVDASPPPAPDLAPLYTAAVGTLERCMDLGVEVGAGPPRAVLLEHDAVLLCAAPLARGTALVIVGEKSCTLGKLHQMAVRARGALAAGPADAAAPAAAPMPAATRPIPPRGAAAGAARRVQAPASPAPPRAARPEPWAPRTGARMNGPSERGTAPAAGGRPAAGPTAAAPPPLRDAAAPPPAREIIVTGVETFRLATRLVDGVGQLACVRSARLRTYAPGTVTMIVVLEPPHTLASAGAECTEHLRLQVVAETEEQLVLAAPGPDAPRPADANAGGLP
jgi:predicted regulator of Ras-like GTPase activity (Roadblock/LC7/MglB family)